MQYIYYGFGLKFLSNVQIYGLAEEKDQDTAAEEVLISVVTDSQYASRRREGRSALYQEGDSYLLDFGEITYEIGKNEIRVRTRYQELFLSTFFNLPLSVFLLLHHRILLHASAFVRDGKLYPLCAEKGKGKSTLLAYALSQGAEFFCDDTMALAAEGDKIYAVGGASFMKLNRDSCEESGILDFEGKRKNINNKAYVQTIHPGGNMSVDALYFMESGGEEGGMRPVCGRIIANTLIFSNIVGISWFNCQLKELLREQKLFCKLCTEVKLYKYKYVRQWKSQERNYMTLING